MTTPLTGQQLAATQARCGAASDVEWSAFRGGGYPFLIMQGTPAADAEGDDRWDGIGLIAANLALKPAEDMAFIIAAHRDMPALLADNARLRAELERARAEGRAQVIAELRTRATGPMLLRVLDQVAEMFASHPEPMHQPYCVAATQGCCSCKEPTTPACSRRAEAVHQAGCDTDRHA